MLELKIQGGQKALNCEHKNSREMHLNTTRCVTALASSQIIWQYVAHKAAYISQSKPHGNFGFHCLPFPFSTCQTTFQPSKRFSFLFTAETDIDT